MKNKHIISLTLLSALLAACGGSSSSSGGPDVPDVCSNLNIEQCNEVTIPESSSSASSSSEAPPANDLLPLNEDFAVDDSLQFFSEAYKPLLNDNPEDPNNAFYYATSGLDSGRVVVADGKLTIGNARFTLGQRLETQGTHINPDALPADYKINTTTDGTAANFPTTTTWGDLDLAHPWKISFCVAEMEALSGSANNQQFMVYVDNNQSTSSFSIHGTDSLVKQLNVSNFVPGKRVEINIPGNVLVGGSVVDGVLQNPGTTSSFIQLRVPSAGVVTMSKLWIGYQSDTATEPAASTCAADTRVPNWNVALPAETPTAAPSATSQDSQLAISWTALARASSYQLAYNTSDSVTGATLSEDIAGAPTTSYTINGLQNNQTYFVFLRAKNSAGVYTDWSPSVSATPQAASEVPAAPDAPTILAGDGQIEVSWTGVINANSYVVAYNTVDNASTASVFGSPTTETSMVVTGLTNDVPYYIFVKAVNSAGDSTYSASATATPVAPVATSWEGQVVDLIGALASPEAGTAPAGSITEEAGVDDTVYVLRATGGIMDSSTGFRTYFASKAASGDFQFTARIASVTTATGEFTAPGNAYGYGIMVMQEIPAAPVADYASVPRFATMNLYTASVTPTFAGSRATKVDSASGTRSRSNVTDLNVGYYVRIQVYEDPASPGTKRVRRFISADGITYTQVNSTSWSGTVGNDWRVGFYGAPGSEDVFIRYDHVVLEAYDPSAASSSAASSVSSSSAVSSVASSDSSSSVASSSASSDSSSSAVSSSAASDSSSSVSSDSSVSSSADSSSSAVSSSDSSSSAAGGSSSSAAAIGWSVYNGDLHPTAANSIALADNSLDTFTYSGASPTDADFFTVASGVATFNSTTVTADKLYAQYNTVLPSSITYPRYYTGLIRAKGNGTNRVIEFDTSISDGTNGSRIKLVLRADGSNQGIQIEKADGTTSENGYSGTYDSYRIYQVAVTLTSATTGSIEVYQDGSDTPIISHAESTLLSGGINNYVRLGDGGSSAYAADIDWVIWTFDGAYKPSDLLGKLPAGLGDTTGY